MSVVSSRESTFFGDYLEVITDHTSGMTYVKAKSLCKVLGIAWQSQSTKLSEDIYGRYRSFFGSALGPGGKKYRYVMLPVDTLKHFLEDINLKNLDRDTAKKLADIRERFTGPNCL